MKLLVITFALLCLTQAIVPLLKATGPVVPNSYLITFSNNATFAQTEGVLSKTSVEKVFSNIPNFNVYHVKMTDEQLASVLQDNTGSVLHIEPDQVVTINQACSSQTGSIWNLARVSNDNFDSTTYSYAESAGEGVTSYIVDTGIYVKHQQFEGRAIAPEEANFVPGESNEDLNGHGTHVAGTVGGKTFGIAKKVNLVAVKVLDEFGSGSFAGIISGMDWVVTACKNPRKCNINMSLGGSRSTTVNDAATRIVNAGITVVVASGNSNDDACYYSPASATGVISVGATEKYRSSSGDIDRRSTFSNYGTCVDVFAPGTKIESAWIGSPSATSIISGTSMASPHVCGVASLIQASGNYPPGEVLNRVRTTGQKNVITLNCANSACNASPNVMLHTDC